MRAMNFYLGTYDDLSLFRDFRAFRHCSMHSLRLPFDAASPLNILRLGTHLDDITLRPSTAASDSVTTSKPRVRCIGLGGSCLTASGL